MSPVFPCVKPQSLAAANLWYLTYSFTKRPMNTHWRQGWLPKTHSWLCPGQASQHHIFVCICSSHLEPSVFFSLTAAAPLFPILCSKLP